MPDEFTQSSRSESAVAAIEESARLRSLCRARLLEAQASVREQTASAARLVAETRALISSLKRLQPKKEEPIHRRGGDPRNDVLSHAQRSRPARTSINFDLHRRTPLPAFPKCGPAEASARITASIAAMALGEQYNQIVTASMKGQPIDASVVRQKLQRIAQLLDAGGQKNI